MLIKESKESKERNESKGASTHFLADVGLSSTMTGVSETTRPPHYLSNAEKKN